jgi:hypothetical protein
LNGLYDPDGGGANYGLEQHAPSAGNLTPPGRGIIIDPPDGQPPFQPWARAERDARNTPMRGYDDPTAHCFPAGVPRAMYVPTPLHIVQTGDAVATLHERMQWRLISLNRTRHLPDTTRLWQGDSIGHWDGDTLVVDTKNYSEANWMHAEGEVSFHSDALHIVERYRRINKDTMEVEATIEDPKVLTKSWAVPKQTLRLANFDQIMALDCTGVESAALMEAASKQNYGKK